MADAGVSPTWGPRRTSTTWGCSSSCTSSRVAIWSIGDAAVGLASATWAHGRWRFDFSGEPNHAGATRMEDRHDPMLTYAMTALAANKQARLAGARATFGRVAVEPNATNAIPSLVTGWLDARGPEAAGVDALVATIEGQASERAGRDGTTVQVTAESVSPTVDFDSVLTARLARVLGDVPSYPRARDMTRGSFSWQGFRRAMLFVRNPTGISHSPAELAEPCDCLAGVERSDRWSRSSPVTTYWCEYAALPDRGSGGTVVASDVASRSRTACSPLIEPGATPGEREPPYRLDDSRLGELSQPRVPSRAAGQDPTRASGTFWTWREQMYALAGRLDPDTYLSWRARCTARWRGRHHQCRRVPLRPSRPGWVGRTTIRTPWVPR